MSRKTLLRSNFGYHYLLGKFEIPEFRYRYAIKNTLNTINFSYLIKFIIRFFLNLETKLIKNYSFHICLYTPFQTELRCEERITEEQKRHRELLTRVEREAFLHNENCQIKIKTIELEMGALRDEHQRLRLHCDKQASDLHATEEKLEISRDNLKLALVELAEEKTIERK